MRNAEKDATEMAEGLIYPSEEQHDMTGELVMLKEIILKAFTKRISKVNMKKESGIVDRGGMVVCQQAMQRCI